MSTRSSQPLIASERVRTATPPTLAPLGATLIAIGLAMTIAGWLDVALAWVPTRFGNNEWEFATVSRTFDGMALGTLGVSLFAVGAMLRRYRLLLGLIVVVFALMTCFVLAAAGLYLLNVPVAIGGVQDQVRGLLNVAILRTSAFIVVYVLLYSWLTWFCWRQYRAL